MRFKTILLTTMVTSTMMCGPNVYLYAEQAKPHKAGWFGKKKKSESKDSISSQTDYEKLTGGGTVLQRGVFSI